MNDLSTGIATGIALSCIFGALIFIALTLQEIRNAIRDKDHK